MTDPTLRTGQNATIAIQQWAARTFVPGGPVAPTFVRCHPWTDEHLVASELARLSGSLGWRVTTRGRVRDMTAADVALVAHSMARVAAGSPSAEPDVLAGVAWNMIHNVGMGREPEASDLLGDHVAGAPARSMRRYRRDHGSEALDAYLARAQDRVYLGILTSGGRTEGAARRWLQRWRAAHPGGYLVSSELTAKRLLERDPDADVTVIAAPRFSTASRTANASVQKGPG